MPMPTEGAPAPDFTLPDQDGNAVHLAELRGRKVALYFYPKDDTPGCTIEACGFRDSHPGIRETGAVVLGVSPDDAESHKKFIGKFGLPFPLLCDVDHQVAEAYGAWGEKNNYGKKYMGILRSTFLIDEQGNLQKVWPKVSPQGHDQEVLAAIRGEAAPAKVEAAPAAAKAPSAPSSAAKKPAAKTSARKPAAPKRSAKPAKKPAKKAAKKPAVKKTAARKGARTGAAKKTAARKGARTGAPKKTAARRPAKKPARKARR